ncbi:MAG: sensor histidine kinase [Bacteroidota bacterium]
MESENQIKFYFGIITVMLAFVIITGGFILAVLRYQKRLYFKQQELLRLDAQHKKELLQISIETAEAERMQIAKDVHDEIGSIFSTLSLSINQLNGADGLNAQHLQTGKHLIQSGIDSVRRISHNIVPFELELLGLEQTIENYFDRLTSVSGIEVDFENTAPLETLVPTATLALYRIVQELSSNCIKYAKAKTIRLHITTENGLLILSYKDDGVGTELISSRGIGLKNIESRAIVMNGEVNFVSAPGEGFACTVAIPLTNNTVV